MNNISIEDLLEIIKSYNEEEIDIVKKTYEFAKELLEKYLSGEVSCLESLEEERLYKGLNGFITYSQISSPNLKT